MTTFIALTVLLLVTVDQQAPPAAPGPGSPATYKPGEELLAAGIVAKAARAGPQPSRTARRGE